MERTPIRFCQDWTNTIRSLWVSSYQPNERLLKRKLVGTRDAEAIAVSRRHIESAQ
jgi:hypothetical protein